MGQSLVFSQFLKTPYSYCLLQHLAITNITTVAYHQMIGPYFLCLNLDVSKTISQRGDASCDKSVFIYCYLRLSISRSSSAELGCVVSSSIAVMTLGTGCSLRSIIDLVVLLVLAVWIFFVIQLLFVVSAMFLTNFWHADSKNSACFALACYIYHTRYL